jgi:site-specific recombinase XerD
MTVRLPAEIALARVSRLLTAAEFHQLADVSPEVEWFANLTNRHTRRVYENATRDLMGFTGIRPPAECRTVTRAHVIAWREDLVRRERRGSTLRHRLSLLAGLFEYLCEKNAVTHNPVKCVTRPKTESGEGKTPTLSAIIRHASCWRPRRLTASRPSATAPSFRPSCSARCGAENRAS